MTPPALQSTVPSDASSTVGAAGIVIVRYLSYEVAESDDGILRIWNLQSLCDRVGFEQALITSDPLSIREANEW